MRFVGFVVLLGVGACGGGGSEEPVPAGPDGGVDAGTIDASVPELHLALDFERIDAQGLSPVRGHLHLARGTDGVEGAEFAITVSTGTASLVTDLGGGDYQFDITPSQTDEIEVTASAMGLSITRTALVLAAVGDGWGQPQMVPGLVNTPGYEDGVTSSADGQYLFVHYGPWYFSGLILYDTPRDDGGCGGSRLIPERCDHPWIDEVIGPTTGPERPGFFDGRLANGKFLHNSTLYDVAPEEAPIILPATMFYGFRRQSDGSYGEPFYLAFDDQNDAIANPFGMSFVLHDDGTATMAFTHDQPGDTLVDLGDTQVDSGMDIFTLEVQLGEDTRLGTYLPGSFSEGTPPTATAPYPSSRVGLSASGTTGLLGTQGNVHLHADDQGAVQSLWTDDEYDSADGPANDDYHEIAVHVLQTGSFPAGTWERVILPAPVNTAAAEIQPFFRGDELIFVRDTEIFSSSYSGEASVAGYGNAANWGASEKILGKSLTFAVGEIIAVGEPTIATIDGRDHLFFVYARIRGFDAVSGIPDIDMQAGFVPHRQGRKTQ